MMGNESWRLSELWEKHSRNNAGMKIMDYFGFLNAMQDFIKTIEWKPEEDNERSDSGRTP